jgi:hypothetical protein
MARAPFPVIFNRGESDSQPATKEFVVRSVLPGSLIDAPVPWSDRMRRSGNRCGARRHAGVAKRRPKLHDHGRQSVVQTGRTRPPTSGVSPMSGGGEYASRRSADLPGQLPRPPSPECRGGFQTASAQRREWKFLIGHAFRKGSVSKNRGARRDMHHYPTTEMVRSDRFAPAGRMTGLTDRSPALHQPLTL